MSNEAINWAYKQEVGCGAKFVLVTLADFADENWSCYPGQERLAKLCGMTDRTVRTHLAWLEEQGFLMREKRFLKSGERTSDRYTINRKNLPKEDSPPEELSGSPPENISGEPLEDINPQIVEMTRAREAEIIEVFENHLEANWGERRDASMPTDSLVVTGWLEDGADVDLCAAIFASVMGRMSLDGRGPPASLKYFDRAIADALAAKNRPRRKEKYKPPPTADPEILIKGWAAKVTRRINAPRSAVPDEIKAELLRRNMATADQIRQFEGR